jgi:hypothetical protein
VTSFYKLNQSFDFEGYGAACRSAFLCAGLDYVAVPVRNEQANLARCLERLKRFAEIVVIDSGSTDKTCAIAESFGARVVDFKWDGK